MQDIHDVRHAAIPLSALDGADTGSVDVFGESASADTHVRLGSLVVPMGRTLRISVSALEGETVALCDDTTERAAEARALAESNRRLEKLLYDLAGAMMGLAEARDPNTEDHSLSVAHLARGIAHEMGLSAQAVEAISMAGLLHDIGKLGVPEDVLANPGVLSPSELELMKGHPAHGSDVLAEIEFPGPIAEIIHQHHERLDGSGYPRGLKGDEILVGGRILAVADVVEAMMSDRPYRTAPGLDEAIQEIGGHLDRYDAAVVAACVRVLRRG